ncbi:hypothetical protein [Zhongshania sp.]|uniref:hypothetical protein n=1 Tax=Zhongshania sp. TaxID=1971902 RepID=UPI0035676E1F
MTDKFIKIYEIDLDYCAEDYGTAPCQAVLGVTGTRKCTNTRVSCQDPDNYNPQPKTYRYYEGTPYLPNSFDGYPALVDADVAPAEIVVGKAVGRSEEITVTLADFADHDRGTDKYARERATGAASSDPSDTYEPHLQGTHCGKLRARNPYYVNRPARYYHGPLPWDYSLPDDEQPHWTLDQIYQNLTVRHYILDKFSGPNSRGEFTIVAKDKLKLTKNRGAYAPKVSEGELSEDFLVGDTDFNLKPGQGAAYPTSGIGSIGRETFEFTRSGDLITVVNGRGNYGTVEEDHSTDDLFQIAYYANARRIDDICEDLIVNYTDSQSSWLDLAQWAAETDQYMPRLYTGIVTKPTEVEKLLDELAEQVGFNLYPNTKEDKIKMVAIKGPDLTAETITDQDWIIEDSVRVQDLPDKRISQVWTSFGVINPQEKLKDQNNYLRTIKFVDEDAEGADQYGESVSKSIFSRWIPRTAGSAVEDVNTRFLGRFRDDPRQVDFKVYSNRESQLRLGDTRLFRSRQIQDLYGEPDTIPIRLIGIEQDGAQLNIRALEQRYSPPVGPGGVNRVIDINTVEYNVNLRTLHDNQYDPNLVGTEPITVRIFSDAVIGSLSNSQYSIVTGSWPAGQPITVYWYGYAGGKGGKGGTGATPQVNAQGTNGTNGGPCFNVTVPVSIYFIGTIGGGGGGGAGGNNGTTFQGSPAGGSGGGGGAGSTVGQGGGGRGNPGGGDIDDGYAGTLTTGGAEGDGFAFAGAGGNGGNLGQAGGSVTGGASGGAAGVAIQGYSNITWVESDGVTLTNGGAGDVPAGGQILGATNG